MGTKSPPSLYKQVMPLVAAKRAISRYGDRVLPGPDTPLGRALQEWRSSLIADLGGEDTVTTQQRAIVDAAVRTKLLLDSTDAYVLNMPSVVNKTKRALFQIVKDRQGLADALCKYMVVLGLERRARDVQDIRQEEGLD